MLTEQDKQAGFRQCDNCNGIYEINDVTCWYSHQENLWFGFACPKCGQELDLCDKDIDILTHSDYCDEY